jgi:formylglycine-generating enzyme required for sulfatase activity
MKRSIFSCLRQTIFIMAAVFLFFAVGSCRHVANVSAPIDSRSSVPSDSKAYVPVATAANGDKILHPTSGATYTLKDGAATIQVPEGMVYVPAGSFVMGNGSSGENAAHKVNLSAYCIGKYQVTNAEWKAFYDETGKKYRAGNWPRSDNDLDAFIAKKGNHPALGISYNNAVEYCTWISKKTGWTVKVPSEAQWERAARGPTTDGSQYIYPWGNELAYDDYKNYTTYIMTTAVNYGQPKKEVTYNGTIYHQYWPFVVDLRSFEVINQKDIAMKQDNKTTTDIDETKPEVKAVWDAIQAEGGGTTPVGSHSPSPAGCYDMAGNAFELTRDWYTVSYHIELAKKMTDPVVEDESVLTDADKRGGSDGDQRLTGIGQSTKIVRGGSWYAHKSSGLTYRRHETRGPSSGTNTIGFRIVVENIKK